MEKNKHTKIIAVVNKKGGVGKTTTVVNIAAGLSQKGKKVLAIDLDQQANLSYWLGFQHDGKPTIAELIMFSVGNMIIDYKSCIRHFDEDNFDYIPAIKSLDGIPSYLAGKNDCTNILKNMFSADFFNSYDYILIDCSPATDLLVANAISASDNLLIPVQCDIMSYNKVSDVLQQLVNIKKDTNVSKYVLGILGTMYQKGTRHSADVLDALRASYGSLVFDTTISYSTTAKNSVGYHISSVKSKSKKNMVGQEYRAVVDAILERLEDC
jgi:chromosome partitioning protein